MLTLLGSFIGFLGSLVPEVFRQFQDRSDKSHELEIFKLQLEQQKQGFTQQLAELNTQADISEMQGLYKTFYSGNAKADFLNGIVRPVIALGFFVLYCVLKIMAYDAISNLENAPFATIYQVLWTEEDAAIFAGIISFYFGNRAMNKGESNMRTSITGIELIKKFEGYSCMLYLCPANKITIGYGHVVNDIEKGAYQKGIHKSLAESIFALDLYKFEKAVGRIISVPLKQGQFDALVSFAYNLGVAALERSTLRQKINRGEHELAVGEFTRWVYCNGVKLPGLLARRKAEAALYASGTI